MNETKIDLLKIAEEADYYVQVKKSFQSTLHQRIDKRQNLLNKLRISRKTLYRITNQEHYWCKLKTLSSLCKLLNVSYTDLHRNIVSIKTKNSAALYLKKINFSIGLARVMGHILGDGGIHIIRKEKKYRPFYVNNEDVLLKSFKSDIMKIFGVQKVYLRYRENHGNEIWLNSTLGFLLYKLLEYDIYGGKRVPNLIKNTGNEKILSFFLQALYDDDGFLYPNKKMVVISLVNRNLLDDIRNLVFKLGITPNKILEHRTKNRSLMYYFSVTGRDNITLFKEKINFNHPLKNEKLAQLLESYK